MHLTALTAAALTATLAAAQPHRAHLLPSQGPIVSHSNYTSISTATATMPSTIHIAPIATLEARHPPVCPSTLYCAFHPEGLPDSLNPDISGIRLHEDRIATPVVATQVAATRIAATPAATLEAGCDHRKPNCHMDLGPVPTTLMTTHRDAVPTTSQGHNAADLPAPTGAAIAWLDRVLGKRQFYCLSCRLCHC